MQLCMDLSGVLRDNPWESFGKAGCTNGCGAVIKKDETLPNTLMISDIDNDFWSLSF